MERVVRTINDKIACLWHAFWGLSDESKSLCHTSLLKVFTHNLAVTFGLASLKPEEIFEEYFKSESEISFEKYWQFLDEAIFQNFNVPSTSVKSIDFDKIDTICWDLCRRKYCSDFAKTKLLNDESCFRLWQIFNFLSEAERNGRPCCPVCMPLSELEIFVLKFRECTRCHVHCTYSGKFEELSTTLSFVEFFNLFLTELCQDLKSELVIGAIKQLHEHFIDEIIKKGYLDKKSTLSSLLSERRRWLVLKPRCLYIYNSSEDKEAKDVLPLSSVRLEVKKQSFILTAGNTISYEFVPPDNQVKNDWIAAIQQAKSDGEKVLTPQQEARQDRRNFRERKKEESRKAEADELEKIAAMRNEEEKRRLLQLQIDELLRNLTETERLLSEERQLREQKEVALREAEIAKNEEAELRIMQAKLLAEEFERTNALEELQRELQAKLTEEQVVKDLSLREKEEALRQQQEQLEQLRLEKIAFDKKLLDATEKLQQMEELKLTLQNQLQEKQDERRPLSRAMQEQYKIITLRDPSFAVFAKYKYDVERKIKMLKAQQSVVADDEVVHGSNSDDGNNNQRDEPSNTIYENELNLTGSNSGCANGLENCEESNEHLYENVVV